MTNTTIIDWERRIIDWSGMERDEIIDAATHGADTGWPGFTYTADGADFTDRWRSDIMDLLCEDAADMGYENWLDMVKSFARVDMAETPAGFDCLLAWYVLERTGRELADEG